MKWSFSLQFQSIKRESEYNMKELSQNKWVRAAIPALLLHCSIGTVYCWSIFSQEIADYIGFSKGATEWAFSFAIFFLGMSAAFLGNIVEKDIHKVFTDRCDLLCSRYGRYRSLYLVRRRTSGKYRISAGHLCMLWLHHGNRSWHRLSFSREDPDALV